ncbi:MAG: rRNA processing protein RimM [Deltaproteobacteria bacterium]|nr:rRNA processing protein RimM [Deltaproteobacteria bacterium]
MLRRAQHERRKTRAAKSSAPPELVDGRAHEIVPPGRAVTAVPEALIPLGQIVSTHATRGELRGRLYNPASTTLRRGSHVVLRHGPASREWVVSAVRPHRHLMLLTLEGCDSMTAAETLIGHEICVPAADLPPAGADEIYYHELMGMTVVTNLGEEVGVVAAMMTTAISDICVVRAGGREYLIPMIAHIVKAVDRAGRRIVIDPLPGLLDT